MGVYGRLILTEQSLESFIMDTFCDGDMDRMRLCLKYIAKKLKPLQQTVSKAISNLKMGSYCTIVSNYDSGVSDILYIGMEIARFNHTKITDENGKSFDLNTDEGYDKLHRELRRKSNKLIDEVKKLNNIEGIYFGFYNEERDHSVYNPAVFLKMEKKFFDDFIKENPLTPQKSEMDSKKIISLINKKLKMIIGEINENQQKLIFTGDVIKDIKDDIEGYKSTIADIKSYTPASWIKRTSIRYFNSDEKDIPQDLIEKADKMLKDEIFKTEKEMKSVEVLLNKKLEKKVSISIEEGKNEVLISITNLSPVEKRFVTGNIVNIIRNKLENDKEIKSLGLRYDKDPRDSKLKSILRKRYEIDYIFISF